MAGIIKQFTVSSDNLQGIIWPTFTDILLITGTHPFVIHMINAIHKTYKFRKTTPQGPLSSPSSRVILSIFWIAFGGGTVASILMNQVPTWLTIPELIPIYLMAYAAIYTVPGVYEGLLSVASVAEILFEINDAVIRGYYLTLTIETFKATSVQAYESILGQILVGIISMTFGGISYSWAMVPGRVLILPAADATVIGIAAMVYILGTEFKIFDGRVLINVLGGPRILTKNDIGAITVLVVVIGFLNRATFANVVSDIEVPVLKGIEGEDPTKVATINKSALFEQEDIFDNAVGEQVATETKTKRSVKRRR